MVSCEKCWRDAHRGGPCEDVAKQYAELIEERKDTPCTPEEQAGEDATECPTCGRRVRHQHTGQCMAGCGTMGAGE